MQYMAELNVEKQIRTRIAPSPTGEDLHIGNLYTAFINYIWAKKHNGSFIVRIEDTDKTRFIEGSEQKILQTLKDYKVSYDEGPDKDGNFGPYRQSDRLSLYQEHAKRLVRMRKAYYCFCSKERLEQIREQQAKEKKIPRYDKYCLTHITNAEDRLKNRELYVIRLNIEPNKKIWFDDVLRGRVEFDSNLLDDQVLLKSDGYPTYHLAVVVDDNLMKITHVIRAEDWISSTPKHVILYESFGWELPIFAHVPLLRNPDKSKLSKRKNPVWAGWYLKEGYLSEAVLNYLILMGWSHPEGKEICTIEEIIRVFELKDMHTVGPVFDINKLTWMNGVYIRDIDTSELKKRLIQFDQSLKEIEVSLFDAFLSIAKSRMKTLADFKTLVIPFIEHAKVSQEDTEQELKHVLYEKINNLELWSKDEIARILLEVAKDKGIKFPIYYKVILGVSSGLPLADAFEIIGKERVLNLLS